MSVFLAGESGQACDAVLTGHGLDYTLRGYYLPRARFARLAGSGNTVVALRRIPAHPTGADVLKPARGRSARQRPTLFTRARKFWWQSQAFYCKNIDPWLASEEPYSAGRLHPARCRQALRLHRHDVHALDTCASAFDREVFELCYKCPRRGRCRGRIVQRALRLLSRPMRRRCPTPTIFSRRTLSVGSWWRRLLGRAVLQAFATGTPSAIADVPFLGHVPGRISGTPHCGGRRTAVTSEIQCDLKH